MSTEANAHVSVSGQHFLKRKKMSKVKETFDVWQLQIRRQATIDLHFFVNAQEFSDWNVKSPFFLRDGQGNWPSWIYFCASFISPTINERVGR